MSTPHIPMWTSVKPKLLRSFDLCMKNKSKDPNFPFVNKRRKEDWKVLERE